MLRTVAVAATMMLVPLLPVSPSVKGPIDLGGDDVMTTQGICDFLPWIPGCIVVTRR